MDSPLIMRTMFQIIFSEVGPVAQCCVVQSTGRNHRCASVSSGGGHRRLEAPRSGLRLHVLSPMYGTVVAMYGTCSRLRSPLLLLPSQEVETLGESQPAPAETGQRRQRRERKRRQCQCSCLLCDERRVVTTHYTLHITHYTITTQ